MHRTLLRVTAAVATALFATTIAALPANATTSASASPTAAPCYQCPF